MQATSDDTSGRDKPRDVNPMTLPWNRKPTYEGEQEVWEDLRHDIMAAFDDGDLRSEEVRWYLTIMAEMFDSGDMRTPAHVLGARMCFLGAAPGEA